MRSWTTFLLLGLVFCILQLNGAKESLNRNITRIATSDFQNSDMLEWIERTNLVTGHFPAPKDAINTTDPAPIQAPPPSRDKETPKKTTTRIIPDSPGSEITYPVCSVLGFSELPKGEQIVITTTDKTGKAPGKSLGQQKKNRVYCSTLFPTALLTDFAGH